MSCTLDMQSKLLLSSPPPPSLVRNLSLTTKGGYRSHSGSTPDIGLDAAAQTCAGSHTCKQKQTNKQTDKQFANHTSSPVQRLVQPVIITLLVHARTQTKVIWARVNRSRLICTTTYLFMKSRAMALNACTYESTLVDCIADLDAIQAPLSGDVWLLGQRYILPQGTVQQNNYLVHVHVSRQ